MASSDDSEVGRATVKVRTEWNHSDNGHTVSLLVHLGQRELLVKMISHPTQKSARPR
jgi:hypothetical protein